MCWRKSAWWRSFTKLKMVEKKNPILNLRWPEHKPVSNEIANCNDNRICVTHTEYKEIFLDMSFFQILERFAQRWIPSDREHKGRFSQPWKPVLHSPSHGSISSLLTFTAYSPCQALSMFTTFLCSILYGVHVRQSSVWMWYSLDSSQSVNGLNWERWKINNICVIRLIL